jgi:acetyl esterase/lipase
MNCSKIEFTSSSSASLTPYLLSSSKADNPFILVVPGGGYDHYGHKEQDDICRFFNEKGFSSAVLHYTLSPFKFPDALFDLALAVAYIKQNSDIWKIDKTKITVMGFSAGGHLCASLGCFYNSPLLENLKLNGKQLNPSDFKPHSLCLCYPVISSKKEICHEGSILRLTENLTENDIKQLCTLTRTQQSENFTEDARRAVSLEEHVNADFPPVFIWHTNEDKAVKSENTLLFALALKSKEIDFEYHLFEKGEHGLALAQDTQAGIWPELFINWLNNKWNSRKSAEDSLTGVSAKTTEE